MDLLLFLAAVILLFLGLGSYSIANQLLKEGHAGLWVLYTFLAAALISCWALLMLQGVAS